MDFQSFDRFEDVKAELDRATKEADERVRPFQAALVPGMYYMTVSDDTLFIYGEILDPSKRADGKPFESEDEKREYEEQAEVYGRPHMQNYRFVRAHSVACPEGEIGDHHVSAVAAVLSSEEFEAVRDARWPGAEVLLRLPEERLDNRLRRLRHAAILYIERSALGD